MRLLPLLLLLPLLTGYRTYLPASAEPPDPFAWTANYDQSQIYSALANFDHMPLDQLPQDLQASLVLTEETGFDGFYPTHWGHWRTYAAPGLKIHTSAPSKAYLDHLEEISTGRAPRSTSARGSVRAKPSSGPGSPGRKTGSGSPGWRSPPRTTPPKRASGWA